MENMPPGFKNVVTWMVRPNQNNLSLCERHEKQEQDSLMQVEHGLHRGECDLCRREWNTKHDNNNNKVIQ
jgi:hypothetical protein